MKSLNCIIEFSIENCFSFLGKQTFSMISSSDNSLKSNLILIPGEKYELSSASAIYGANGSGKTNIIKSISLFQLLLSESSRKKSNEKIFFTPFKLAKEKPTTFEIHFISEGIRYFYNVSFDSNRIYKETLYTFPDKRQKKVFERIYNHEENTYTYTYSREYTKELKDIEIKSLENKFFLSTASEWCSLKEIKDSISFLLDKIVIHSPDPSNFITQNWTQFSAKKLEKDEEIKELFLKMLKDVNPCIKNISSKVSNVKMSLDEIPSDIPLEIRMLLSNSEGINTDIKIHYNNENLIMDLSEESSGIIKLFEIGVPILDILLNGKILFFDELETSLHPVISKKIINLFLNRIDNKNNAQLIFTTHDVNLLDLDLLRRDQIWFVEKSEKTDYTTQLSCLSHYSVRKDENIRRGYLQGKFTQIPTGINFILNDFHGGE